MVANQGKSGISKISGNPVFIRELWGVGHGGTLANSPGAENSIQTGRGALESSQLGGKNYVFNFQGNGVT